MTFLFLSAMQKARQMCRDTQEIYLFVSILQQIDLYTHIHLWNSPPFEKKKISLPYRVSIPQTQLW